MRVRTPEGQRYRVGRRWLPWRRRMRSMPDVPLVDGLMDVPVLNIIVLIVLIPAVLVFAVLLVELLVLLALLPLYLLARIALRAPWVVEVTCGDVVHHQESVLGWAGSGSVRDGIAERLRSGAPIERVLAERHTAAEPPAPGWDHR